MFKRSTVATAALIAMGAIGPGAALPAFGQPTLDRVEITGSAVRRIDAEASLPVQVIKKEDIERSGATSITDLLQRLPAIQGSFSESSSVGGSSGGFTGVSVHNIGEQRTLVLLNGHRLTLFGGQVLTGFAAAVDLNAIPISAIERVEILTDGASALYGSDAVAGVVNFITRRNTTEGDVSIGISSPKGGAQETRISASKGFGSMEKDGYNLMLAFSADRRTKLNATDRNFGKSSRVPFTYNGQSYQTIAPGASPIPAAVLDDLGQFVQPFLLANGVCPPNTLRKTEPYNDGSGLVDDWCSFDFVSQLEIYPERKRDNFLATFNKKLTDNHELYADLMLSRTQQITRIAPVPGSIFIPATSPLFTQYLNPVGIFGTDVLGTGELGTLAFYRLFDLGKRTSDYRSTFYDIALGSKGLMAGWDYNLSYTRSQSENKEDIAGYPGARAVAGLRASGLLDPFIGPGQQSPAGQAAINNVAYKGYWDGGIANLDTVSLRGSREVGSLAGGPMMLGAGVNYQIEKFQKKPSAFAQGLLADPVAGTPCDPANGIPCDSRFGDEATTEPYSADRKAWGLFGELLLPVSKELEFTTALRYDNYSDFGDTINGKVSFRWSPVRSFLVRGSVGTGFRAPTVPQVNATQQPFGVTSGDYNCTPELQQLATSLSAQCQPGSRQYDIIGGGNRDLQPEKSRQASIGLRFEPVPQLSLGADLWTIAISDAFGQLGEGLVFSDPLRFPASWTTKRDTGTGANFLAFRNDNKNLGNEYYTGIDVDVVGRAKTPVGDLNSQLNLTYMIREARQLEPGGRYYSAIGDFSELDVVTFRVQGRWANTLRMGNWGHTLTANFKSGYRDAEATVEVLDAAGNIVGQEDLRLKVKRFVTWDWQTSWLAGKNLTITAGALNLFDTKPPLSISEGGLNRGQQFGFDDRYYDSRGRTLYGNVSYRF
jgi:iron complex outermembrane recepter protein